MNYQQIFQVRSDWVHNHVVPTEENGIQTALNELKFILSPRLLNKDVIKVVCVASITDEYWGKSFVEVGLYPPYPGSYPQYMISSSPSTSFFGEF